MKLKFKIQLSQCAIFGLYISLHLQSMSEMFPLKIRLMKASNGISMNP